jgi:hypothetical protein
MTRETKIGLLVGLAFIIVIGILLSDHMTSTTQPPQAALGDATNSVRESVATPAPTGAAPPAIGNVPPINPAHPVPTTAELRTPSPSPTSPVNGPIVTRVRIGPAEPGQQPPTQPQITIIPPVQQQQPTGPVVIANDPPKPEQPTGTGTRETTTQTPQPQPPANPPKPVATNAGAKREYIAQAGDSLSRMASKLMGSNSKANREAIIKANPSLQKNPEIVVEGRKYTIPAAAPAAPTASGSSPTPSPVVANGQPSGGNPLLSIPDTVPVTLHGQSAKPLPVTQVVDRLPTSTPREDGGTWYVVKDKDSLWKIATEQVGDAKAVAEIQKMNEDVLKGGETVQPNMRLRLPAKRVASAN